MSSGSATGVQFLVEVGILHDVQTDSGALSGLLPRREGADHSLPFSSTEIYIANKFISTLVLAPTLKAYDC
jgi:hypothetical protein